jgi:hypothetical protein
MSFLAPLALLLGLLALPIILLYMLRLRRREQVVSSTLLWQQLVRDREANAPWQRLRRNLLLLLQLLILLALAVALARPYLPVPSVAGGNVVVLLDGSASMLATDVAPTRFDAARAAVQGWIDDLGSDDRMTLIVAGRTPRLLISGSNDRRQLREALLAAHADAAPADWPAAFSLAAGAAQGFNDARIVLVSDGGLPADLPPLTVETVYVPIGTAAANLALSAMATRATPDGPALLVRVSNGGPAPQTALVSVTTDGQLFDARRIAIEGGATQNLTWQLPPDTSVASARLSEQRADYLPADDQAWAVHAGGVRNRALLITPGNLFLEQAFRHQPGMTLFTAPPGTPVTGEDGAGYDLYIFDGVPLPATLPDAPILVVNPQAAADGDPASGEASAGGLLRVGAPFTDTAVIEIADSPLLQFVSWSGVSVRAARSVTAPGAQTLVAAAGGPLLLAGEQSGRRFAVLTFDLHDSDLPLRIAFPVLMANITAWLNPGQAFDAPTGLLPGEALAITPDTGTTAVLVRKPDGTLWTRVIDAPGAVRFEETDQPGLYTVTMRAAAGDRPAGAFAVNLFAPGESALAPAASVSLGQAPASQAQEEAVGQRELWPWLAALALLLLTGEWWVFFRGTRWPALRPAIRRVRQSGVGENERLQRR